MNSYLMRVLLCVGAAFVAALIFAAVPAHAQILRKDGILPLLLLDRGYEPFGLSSDDAPPGPIWVRWHEFEAGVVQNTEALAGCRTDAAMCTPAAIRLLAIIDSVRDVQGRARLGFINRAINLSIAYTSDRVQHGAGDIWSSALETFSAGQGDCEDFAIAKYVALREAGIAAQDLRLLVGRIPAIDQAHAVVAARLDGHWLILDNRRMTMVEDVQVTELQPMFVLDNAGVRQFGAPAATVSTAVSARPSGTIAR